MNGELHKYKLALDQVQLYKVNDTIEHKQDKNETDRLKQLSMDDAIEDLTNSLLQSCGHVRKRAAYHPPPQWDLMYVFDRNGGIKQGSNMNGQLDSARSAVTIAVLYCRALLLGWFLKKAGS